ncbi:unnamed protein product [Arabis nemorensis]|uniref:Uncharacterized protein n=1 Tax=Arabis nemorensis TaxID=586526 RepID=A0A565B0K6_9BRAS|nr:unnamed protein product [Arabis nemorensis]
MFSPRLPTVISNGFQLLRRDELSFFIVSPQLLSQGKSSSSLWILNLTVDPPPLPDPPTPPDMHPFGQLLATREASCRSVGLPFVGIEPTTPKTFPSEICLDHQTWDSGKMLL